MDEIPLKGYQVMRELGEGNLGKVYEAREKATGLRVALKIFKKEIGQRVSDGKRFFREVQIARALCHPNIVQIYAVGDEGPEYWLAMEYLDGESLSQRVAKRGPLPWHEALSLALPLADALVHAHGEGIVHRDINPDNIVITWEGVPKLIDLGLAKSLLSWDDTTITHTGMALGTPPYLSPEQAANGKTADAASDIYSLGATLYFMLTGAPPFSGQDVGETLARIIQGVAIPLRQLQPLLPEAVESLVHKMMARQPRRRMSNARLVREQIQQILQKE